MTVLCEYGFIHICDRYENMPCVTLRSVSWMAHVDLHISGRTLGTVRMAGSKWITNGSPPVVAASSNFPVGKY